MAAREKVYPPAGSGRVESSRVESSRVESSRVKAHESYRVKSLDAACLILVSRTAVIGREGCCFALGTECSKVSSFSEGLTGILRHPLKFLLTFEQVSV